MTGFFGSQTVDFIQVSDGTPDRFRHPEPVETVTPVAGCLLRTLSHDERSGEDLATLALERVRVTAPATPETMNMTARDLVRYNGITYHVIGGSRVCRDLEGNVSQVVLEAVRES